MLKKYDFDINTLEFLTGNDLNLFCDRKRTTAELQSIGSIGIHRKVGMINNQTTVQSWDHKFKISLRNGDK